MCSASPITSTMTIPPKGGAIEGLGISTLCAHVESPDEASHEGRADEKVKALEAIDRHIVGPLLEALAEGIRRMASAGLAGPPNAASHEDAQPRRRADGDGRQRTSRPDGFDRYDDPTAARSDLVFPEGWRAMGYFITGPRLSPS